MATTNHLKNKAAQKFVLTVAFGLQAVKGHLVRSTSIGSDPTHQIVAYMALGEGEWDACLGAYYQGVELLPADYDFHPGALATAMDTGDQVVDENFEGDVPHSRTAAIGFKGPVGIGSADTKTNPPTEFEGIFRTKKCADFDDSGAETGFSYSANPARVMAELLMTYGRLPNLPEVYDSHRDYWISRIDWEVWTEWLNYCGGDEEVDYRTWDDLDGFGLTADYYNGTSFGTHVVKFVQPVIDLTPGAASPAGGVTANNFSARFEGFVKPEFSENYTFALTHSEGAKLWVNGTLVIDQWASSGTHSSSPIALTADTFYTIKVEWKNTGSSAEIQLEWTSTSVPYEVIPAETLYPKVEDRPRYEAHVFFESPINFADAMRSILLVSNSVVQDVDGKLRFYCLEQLESSFTLDDSNIDQIRFRRRDILQADPVTAFESTCRDLDSQFLEEPKTPVRVEPAYLGRKNAENIRTIDLFTMTRWQARKVLEMRAKIEVGHDLILEIDSKLAKTYPVIAGDIVTVDHRKIGGDPLEYLVREATEGGVAEAPGERGTEPEKRTFVLQNWS